MGQAFFAAATVPVFCAAALWAVARHGEASGAIAANEWLEGAKFYVYLVPVSVLDLCGSLLVCRRYREATRQQPRSWLETLLSCTLMQFGGTTLTGWLLGQTPSWILSHSAFPALLLAWWLTFYCPGDLFHSALLGSPLAQGAVLPIVTALSAVSSGHAVTSWGLDKALDNTFHTNAAKYSQSALTCILAGTLSASGGGIIADCLSLVQSPSFVWRSPTLLQNTPQGDAAARVLTRSFFLSSLYYVLLLPAEAKQPLHQLLLLMQLQLPLSALQISRPAAKAVIAALQLQSAGVALAYGADSQYTALAKLARRCLFVRDNVVNDDNDERAQPQAETGAGAEAGAGEVRRAPKRRASKKSE